MAMTGILRPGHVQLRVLELGPALHHYKEMVGLIETARDDEGRVYLKAWDEQDLFSLVLREAESPGLDFYGFKVLDKKTLEHYAKRLTDYGVAIERIPAGDLKGTGERIRFETPSGHPSASSSRMATRNSSLGSKKKSKRSKARQAKARVRNSSMPVAASRAIPATATSTMAALTKKWMMVLR